MTIIDNGQPGYAESAAGAWGFSSLKGYNDSTSRVTLSGDMGVYAEWAQVLAPGTYKVSIYKIVHSLNDPNAKIEVVHSGVTDAVYVNYQSGTSGWVELGTYDFAGYGNEKVKLLKMTSGTNIRADAVKFERVEVVTTATLTSPADMAAAPVTTEPALTFNRPLDAGTLEMAAPMLKETVSGTVIAATYTWSGDGRVLTLHPAGPLQYETSYTVLLTNEGQWRDIYGNPVEPSFLRSFTTASYIPDTIIVDNGTAGYTESAAGKWTDSGLQGWNGSNTRVTYDSSAAGAYAEWSRLLPVGMYRVSVYKVAHSSSDPNAKVEIRHKAGTSVTSLNLQTGSTGLTGMGSFEFDPASGQAAVRMTLQTSGTNIRADAVRFERLATYAVLSEPTAVHEVPVSTGVTIRFNRPMDGSTLREPDNIVLKEAKSGAVVQAAYQVGGDAESITLQPLAPLKSYTSYSVTVSSNVRAADGSRMDGGAAYEFRTAVNPLGTYALIRPEHFTFRKGTWSFAAAPGSFSAKVLLGRGDTIPANAQPAVAAFHVRKTGTYRLWVRDRDYSTNQPGTRYFQLGIDDGMMPKTLGRHGIDGFAWEEAGTLELTAGEHTIRALDTSAFFPRLDAVVLTDDLGFEPPDSYDELNRIDTLGARQEEQLKFPAHARSDAQPVATAAIGNDKLRVAFYTVQTSQGTVIQKETFLRSGEEWVQTDRRTDGLAYLLLYSADSPVNGTDVIDMKYLLLNTLSGHTEWMVPSAISITNGGSTAVLTADSEYATMTVVWSTPDGSQEPVVEVRTEAKRNGAYSIGMFAAPERSVEDIDFELLPFQYISKRLPGEFTLATEQYASTPVSLMTLPSNPGNGAAGQISYGIAVDPVEIPNRWTYGDNSRFGLTIRGLTGGVQPGLFAPQFGSTESALSTGQTYTFRYRPVTLSGGWFEAYQHVAVDLFGFTDYRKNVNSSLTDAVFNMQELELNDYYGGWDPIAKAHYNMEGRNTVSQAAPLAPIQSYLLTEDADLYERRTIPTLEYMLTRGGMHFSEKGPWDGSLNLGKISPLTGPVGGYGTSAYGGLYAMTRNQIPLLRQIGVDGGTRPGSNSIPDWSEDLWLYRFNHDPQALANARAKADAYMASSIYAPQQNLPADGDFINISYSPYWQGLIDLYEVTQDHKYLDAAEEAARWHLTTLWTQPKIPDGTVTVEPSEFAGRPLLSESWNGWWHGDVRDRLGYPDKLDDLQAETVEAWIPSRVGLGLEQRSTLRATPSGNIIMSNWAPDLMRLTQYTGNPIYSTYARNAVIGRFSNYPGYYQNKFMVHQMTESYPYEGPDLTNIYYHHVPSLLALSVDFLAAQAGAWSDGAVAFPSVRPQRSCRSKSGRRR